MSNYRAYNYTGDPNVTFPSPRSQEDNPFGKFVGQTPAFMSSQRDGINNFNEAFTRNTPLIERQNFSNKNDVIHNNLHTNLQNDYIIDYIIDIDSKDRNIKFYQNPFQYTLQFGPVGGQTVTRNVGGEMESETLNPVASPCVDRAFKNVRYIKITNVTLPRYYGITNGGSGWVMDTTKDLTQLRYVVMVMGGLDSRNNMSTNTLMNGNGIKLIPDVIPNGGNFYYAIPSNTIGDEGMVKIYNMSKLGNLSKIPISFYDPSGNQILYTNLDSTQAINSVQNPLNILTQNDITMILGISENELATNVKYYE